MPVPRQPFSDRSAPVMVPLRQKGPKSARLSIPDGGTHGVPDPGVWFCLSEPCAAQLLSYR